MNFVGIITDKKNELLFYNYLNKKIDSNIIIINNKNIDNMKNIKFDTLLINKKPSGRYDVLKKILLNSKKIVINSDININLSAFTNTSANIITYGFNPKSTVTASSLENDDALICVQRNFKSLNNKTIEPQEIKVQKNVKSNNPYIIISSEILTLLYDS